MFLGASKRFDISRILVYAVLTAICVIVMVPFLLIVSSSLTSTQTLNLHGYSIIPTHFSFLAYRYIFRYPAVMLHAYGVTITITVIGTVGSVLLTAMMGYVLSRKDFRLVRPATFYVFFTMLFSGGLVPYYILMTHYLHLENSIFSMIIPGVITPFNVMIMKGFLSKIPVEIIESAKVDGASEFRIFFRMVLPLSTPALATLGLLVSFAYWGEWFNALLFINNQNLMPLQLMLYNIMNTVNFLANNPEGAATGLHVSLSSLPTISAQMAMVVLAAGPMMVIFPFFRRYFVQGLTVGSLKS